MSALVKNTRIWILYRSNYKWYFIWLFKKELLEFSINTNASVIKSIRISVMKLSKHDEMYWIECLLSNCRVRRLSDFILTLTLKYCLETILLGLNFSTRLIWSKQDMSLKLFKVIIFVLEPDKVERTTLWFWEFLP